MDDQLRIKNDQATAPVEAVSRAPCLTGEKKVKH
jgi:hypothetical protein